MKIKKINTTMTSILPFGEAQVDNIGFDLESNSTYVCVLGDLEIKMLEVTPPDSSGNLTLTKEFSTCYASLWLVLKTVDDI